jgi:multidrug/hemolysin transport system ATP-binding protein
LLKHHMQTVKRILIFQLTRCTLCDQTSFFDDHNVILDEPTTGLDPQTRVFVWNAIKRLQEETNMTIFLTTHYMEEAAVADNVVVIKEGRLIAEGTPSQLKDQYAFDSLHMILPAAF